MAGMLGMPMFFSASFGMLLRPPDQQIDKRFLHKYKSIPGIVGNWDEVARPLQKLPPGQLIHLPPLGLIGTSQVRM